MYKLHESQSLLKAIPHTRTWCVVLDKDKGAKTFFLTPPSKQILQLRGIEHKKIIMSPEFKFHNVHLLWSWEKMYRLHESQALLKAIRSSNKKDVVKCCTRMKAEKVLSLYLYIYL